MASTSPMKANPKAPNSAAGTRRLTAMAVAVALAVHDLEDGVAAGVAPLAPRAGIAYGQYAKSENVYLLG